MTTHAGAIYAGIFGFSTAKQTWLFDRGFSNEVIASIERL